MLLTITTTQMVLSTRKKSNRRQSPRKRSSRRRQSRRRQSPRKRGGGEYEGEDFTRCILCDKKFKMGDKIRVIPNWGRAVHESHWAEPGPVIVQDPDGNNVNIRSWATGRYQIGNSKNDDAADERFFPVPRTLGTKQGINWNKN